MTSNAITTPTGKKLFLQERRRQLEAERLARLEEVQLKKQEQVVLMLLVLLFQVVVSGCWPSLPLRHKHKK